MRASRLRPWKRLLSASFGVRRRSGLDAAIDELHLDYPFAGSRMLQGLLRGEALEAGRLHVATLMKKTGLEAIDRRPNTSKPAPGHKIYPDLLRKLAVTGLTSSGRRT